jgi:Tol biopolymer transport system component
VYFYAVPIIVACFYARMAMTRVLRAAAVLLCGAIILAGPSAIAGKGSDESSRLYFTQPDDGTDQEVYSILPDGTDVRRFTDNDRYEAEIEWSPDGSRLLIVRDDAYLLDSDGRELGALGLAEKRRYLTHFSWSLDSRKLVYVEIPRYGSRRPLMIVPAVGSAEPRRVPGVSGIFPVWTPDGKRIIFTRTCYGKRCPARGEESEGRLGMYSVRPDGTHLRRIHRSVKIDYPQDMTRDGRLLFLRVGDVFQEDEESAIYWMRPGKSGPRLIDRGTYRFGFDYTNAVWSPDGEAVVALGQEIDQNGMQYMRTFAADGKKEKNVLECETDWSEGDQCPEWVDWGPATIGP